MNSTSVFPAFPGNYYDTIESIEGDLHELFVSLYERKEARGQDPQNEFSRLSRYTEFSTQFADDSQNKFVLQEETETFEELKETETTSMFSVCPQSIMNESLTPENYHHLKQQHGAIISPDKMIYIALRAGNDRFILFFKWLILKEEIRNNPYFRDSYVQDIAKPLMMLSAYKLVVSRAVSKVLKTVKDVFLNGYILHTLPDSPKQANFEQYLDGLVYAKSDQSLSCVYQKHRSSSDADTTPFYVIEKLRTFSPAPDFSVFATEKISPDSQSQRLPINRGRFEPSFSFSGNSVDENNTSLSTDEPFYSYSTFFQDILVSVFKKISVTLLADCNNNFLSSTSTLKSYEDQFLNSLRFYLPLNSTEFEVSYWQNFFNEGKCEFERMCQSVDELYGIINKAIEAARFDREDFRSQVQRDSASSFDDESRLLEVLLVPNKRGIFDRIPFHCRNIIDDIVDQEINRDDYDLCLLSDIGPTGPVSKKLYLTVHHGAIQYKSDLTGKDLIKFDLDRESLLYEQLYDAIESGTLANISPLCKNFLFNQTSKYGHTHRKHSFLLVSKLTHLAKEALKKLLDELHRKKIANQPDSYFLELKNKVLFSIEEVEILRYQVISHSPVNDRPEEAIGKLLSLEERDHLLMELELERTPAPASLSLPIYRRELKKLSNRIKFNTQDIAGNSLVLLAMMYDNTKIARWLYEKFPPINMILNKKAVSGRNYNQLLNSSSSSDLSNCLRAEKIIADCEKDLLKYLHGWADQCLDIILRNERAREGDAIAKWLENFYNFVDSFAGTREVFFSRVFLCLKSLEIIQERRYYGDEGGEYVKKLSKLLDVSDPGILKNSFLHFVLREVQARLARSYSNTPVGVTITLEERVRAVAAQQRVTDQDMLNANMVIKKEFEEKLAAAEKKAITYESELTTTKEDLAMTKAELTTTKEDLAMTKAELTTTKEDLAMTKAELTVTKRGFEEKLAVSEGRAMTYQKELTTTKEDLAMTKADLAKTNQKFSEMEESMKTVQATLLVLASQGKLNIQQTETTPTVYSPGLFGASTQGSASSDAENIPSLT